MVNWTSQEEIARDSIVFTNVIFACFGLYAWEILQTSHFEWSIVKGQRKFSWPMCLHGCSMTAADPPVPFPSIVISLTISRPINCQALYTFNAWAGNMAILCASMTLMLRTIDLWGRNLMIVIPFGVLCLGHWALLWRGMFTVQATYDATKGACSVSMTNHLFLNIMLFMTMGFDLIILVFTVAALVFKRDNRSNTLQLLFTDGLVYFIAAFFVNTLPAIFNVLNLNPVMNIIATVPAATFTAIAACRASICAQDLSKNPDVYVHSTSQLASPMSPRGMRMPKPPRYPTLRPEVHVTTDHIIMEDFVPSPALTSPGKGSDLVDDDTSDHSTKAVGNHTLRKCHPRSNEDG
ncbi:hypothetical protein A0H81_03541 [Grifola frondosa]|uniref:Uncharacterized protein n=1 Tax=Grifola frondosa TaxID=5627 RepID=A0A1C7MKZ0_GRIFR|nr:hypothetical protein A0H81_03541 [Grifola frondosa]